MSEAFDALTEGQKASATGRTADAQRWLERGLRLAPGNSDVILALAKVKLLQRSVEAASMFAHVTHEHDMREAWLGLAIARHQQGEIAQAAEALGHALRRHAYIEELASAADIIANAAAVPGWCGVDSTGRIIVRLTRTPVRGLQPVATLGTRPVTLRRQPGGLGYTARLPEDWEQSATIDVRLGSVPLLGSPMAIDAIVHVEGFVASTNGDLHGWAWCPHDPNRDPVLSIKPLGAGDVMILVAKDPTNSIWHERPLRRLRKFHVPAVDLRSFGGLVRISGPDGRSLTGSPIDPSDERHSAEAAAGHLARLFPAPGETRQSEPKLISIPSVPAHVIGGKTQGGIIKRPVDVIVPVYGKIEMAIACLKSVLNDLPAWARVVVVDDASPDPRVRLELQSMAKRNRITVLRQTLNLGFPGAANVGLRHSPARDAVLLNSDTLTPAGWLTRLRDAAYSAPDIGTATPLSNDATILSYPDVTHVNPIPQLDETVQLDLLAQKANANRVVEIPTAVGFCMYVKRDCLSATGVFREDLFAQGYGEENDFCIRARHLGWRHVAAPGIFLAHVGGQSFGSTKYYLIERNIGVLNRLHPGYDELIQDFQKRDPLADARRRLDMERWKTFRSKAGNSVLLVTHGRGGGVLQRVKQRAEELQAEGLRAIILWPATNRLNGGHECVLGDGPEGGTPNLRFAIPEELGTLARFLKADRPLYAEVHHLIGHNHALFGLFQRLGIPYEAIVHDYSWMCPRVSLIGPDKRYCGEPDIKHCEACVTDAGAMNEEDITPQALRDRSRAELSGATRVVAPSQDAAKRLQRYFPQVRPDVVHWDDDDSLPPLEHQPPASGDMRRICVVGAIGIAKGYEMLLACARDAAMRKLKLQFYLVGHSCDDARLLATEHVYITGRYDEQEVVDLIRAQHAHLGWLPSLWPETWCYTLTHAWRAGLKVAAFDIGAPAERIRRTGRGWLQPLGLSPSALNSQLLAL